MTEFLGIRRDSFRFRFVMEQSEIFFIGGLVLHLFLSNLFKDEFLEIAASGASSCIIINFIFMRIKDGSVIFDQNNLGSSNLKRILSFKCRITSLMWECPLIRVKFEVLRVSFYFGDYDAC